MTDSIAVFPPGFRVTDQNGLPVAGAQISFFLAGTTTPLTVYSDAGFVVPVGPIVACDAYGAPSASGGDIVVYTGTAPYKVQILTSGGALVPGLSFDNVRAAINTSTFGLSATVVWPVVPVTTTGSWSASDLGKDQSGNPTGGQIIRTLPTSASAGNGAYVWIKHDGTANSFLIASQGTDLIHMRGDLGSRQTLTLWEKGDAALFICDSVDWHAHFAPPIHRGKQWIIQARQNTVPISPNSGQAWIITGSPSGAWSAFAADDVVTSDGNGGWIRSRPSTDIGWIAYVAGESLFYRYIASGWRSELATTTTAGTLTAAAAADQAAATSTTAAVTPAVQQLHKSALKAWVRFVGASGAISASYNVASVTRTSAGTYTITFITAMADNNFGAVAGGTSQVALSVTGTSVSSFTITTSNLTYSLTDFTGVYIAVFGN